MRDRHFTLILIYLPSPVAVFDKSTLAQPMIVYINGNSNPTLIGFPSDSYELSIWDMSTGKA